MRLIVLLTALLISPALAQQQPPMSVEQRLALDIARLSMEKHDFGLRIDQQQMRIRQQDSEIARLKARVEELEKDQKPAKP